MSPDENLLLGEITPEVADFLKSIGRDVDQRREPVILARRKWYDRSERHEPSAWSPLVAERWPAIHTLSNTKMRLEEQFLHELGERAVNRLEIV